MDKLNGILEQWEQTKEIEKIISRNLFTDMDAIQKSLDKLPEDRKKVALQTLEEIETALKSYIANLSKEKDSIQVQMEQSTKSMKACSSYVSALRLNANKDKK